MACELALVVEPLVNRLRTSLVLAFPNPDCFGFFHPFCEFSEASGVQRTNGAHVKLPVEFFDGQDDGSWTKNDKRQNVLSDRGRKNKTAFDKAAETDILIGPFSLKGLLGVRFGPIRSGWVRRAI